MAEENDSVLHRIPFSGKFSDIANWLNENFHLIELAIKQNTGKSAYEVWRDYTDGQGNQPNIDKTEEEFLASLKESGYKMQAVTARPSTIAGIEADKIYLYPDGTGQFSTAIYTGDLESSYDSTKWVVLATNPGDLSGAFTDIQGLRVDVNNLGALVGYYTCSTAGADTEKIVSATGYTLTNGGNIRIKMTHANTSETGVTLQIGSAAAQTLYYNGEEVSDENTWEDNETIVVYYDGTKYLATNSLGGGGNSALAEELDAQVNGSTESIELNAQDPSYVSSKRIDTSYDRWLNNNNTNPTIVIPIQPSSSINIVGNATNSISYAILRTFDTSVSPWGQMLTALSTLSANETVTVDATEDGHYLYIKLVYSSGVKYPQSVTQTTYTVGLAAKLKALVGYYTCVTAAATTEKSVNATGYELTNGGNIRIKMLHTNTVSSVTLNINGTGAKPLYYNGEPVDSDNTWKDNEIIVVYYDGEKYCANSLGGNSKLVEELDVQINGKTDSIELNVQDTSYESNTYTDNGSRWIAVQSGKAIIIPIEAGSSITIVGNATHNITYAIMRTFDTTISPSGQMVTGVLTLTAGDTVTVDATEDGHFLQLKIVYYNSLKYPQSVTQTTYTRGLVDEIKFATGENVSDIDIDDSPKENSNGLVKSGYLFDALKALKILRCDTSVLSGAIGSTYSIRIISAGKKVYDEDIIVSKLIFNKNIESASTDTTFTYYVALPNSDRAGLGTAYTGTITAGTNYADVSIKVPAGKIIYVQNKKVVDGGAAATPTGCLIAGWQSSGSDKSFSIDTGGNPATVYAGFSYEYYTAISLKEYIDYKDDNINQKIDKSKVLWSDAKTVFAFGSSLTDQRYAPAGHIWLEEINNLVDANIANYALSGSPLKRNISDCIALNVSPDWILWNNQANGKTESENPELVPFGMNGYIQLANAKEVTESKGAAMLLGGENGTAHGQIPLVNVDRLFDVFASDHHVPRSELRRELVEAYIGNPNAGFNSGVHRGWRTQSSFITKHMELLGNLPISKSVKIYKVRPGSANLEVSALVYDTSLQRIKHFYAISTGMYATVSQFTFAHADNIDMATSNDATAASETRTTITAKETVALRNGDAISIPYGKAVVEFVLDKENVSRGKFSFRCTSEPQVYVSISQNSSTESYTDSPRSTWQLVDEITYSDYNGITEVEVDGKIELGDKVKFLVVCVGSFDISKPSFEYEGGRIKKTPVLNYKPRKYGTELNSNRNIDNNWTLGGNAAIKQIPNAIGYYMADTSHIELTDNGDYAERTVTIPVGTKKVAIRVMATRFVPVMTKRFVGTDAENSEYVSTTQVINNYDCDLGAMDIIIDGAAVSRQVICPGFAWSYVEYATELTATSLKVRVRKPDDDTAPTMIYAMSVQIIE